MAERSELAVSKEPARVAAMFDRIAGRYDLLNHLLSGGLDRWWRARAVKAARVGAGARVLDLCAGTGDFARAMARATPAPATIAAADFAGAMLARAREKFRRRPPPVPVRLIRADARQIPLRDASVDVVTIGFGIRNVADVPAALQDLHRVIAPGGRLVVLEFAMPERRWLRSVYLLYFRRVLPLVGRLVSRHPDAYRYLPESVAAFEAPGELRRLMEVAGFQRVDIESLSGGIVRLYVAAR